MLIQIVLLVHIIALANVLDNVSTLVFDYDNQKGQSSSPKPVLNQTDNSFRERKLLYDHRKYNIQSLNTTAGVLQLREDTPVENTFGGYQRKHPSILRKLNKYLHNQIEGFIGKGVVFNWKKREDGYIKTDPREFPYAVGLLIVRGTPDEEDVNVCSGSLVTDEWVLTAAHCVVPTPNMILVYAGGYSLIEVLVEDEDGVTHLSPTAQVAVSTEYYPIGGYGYDIGLVRLMTKFNMTDAVNTTLLSGTPWRHRGYRKCVMTGFGGLFFDKHHYDDYARKTHVYDIKQPCLCAFTFSRLFDDEYEPPSYEFLCPKPQQDLGLCGGDSGGGLVCDGRIVGVSMLLMKFYDIKYCEANLAKMFFDEHFTDEAILCGGENTLSVFQAVCPDLMWVNKHVKLFSDKEIDECRRQGLSTGSLVHLCSRIVVSGILLISFVL